MIEFTNSSNSIFTNNSWVILQDSYFRGMTIWRQKSCELLNITSTIFEDNTGHIMCELVDLDDVTFLGSLNLMDVVNLTISDVNANEMIFSNNKLVTLIDSSFAGLVTWVQNRCLLISVSHSNFTNNSCVIECSKVEFIDVNFPGEFHAINVEDLTLINF